MGKKTTDENYQLPKGLWKRCLLQDELGPKLLEESLCDNVILGNFVRLAHVRDHEKENNLRSAKLVERSAPTSKLLRALGSKTALRRQKI